MHAEKIATGTLNYEVFYPSEDEGKQKTVIQQKKNKGSISLLDDSFFQPADGHFDFQPLSVGMNVVILNLSNLEMVSQTYKVNLEVWLSWPLTKKDAISYSKAVAEKNKTGLFSWRPFVHPKPHPPQTIQINNYKTMEFADGATIQVFVSDGKLIATECTLITASLFQSMEFDAFPFDLQQLTFDIGIRCDCSVPVEFNEWVSFKSAKTPSYFFFILELH
jgi:hypothetical protein